MGFEYSYTCPDIDQGIENYKDDVKQYLSDMLSDSNPLLQGENKENLINEYSEHICNSFSDNFENVRQSNEDMRKEAEHQIEAVEGDLEEAKDLAKELEERNEVLESRIDELLEEVENV